MNYRIVKLKDFPDYGASLYSIIEDGEGNTLFHKFVEEHREAHRDEIMDILKRLYVMGNSEGAREGYFKKHEGVPGDGVCALYDDENKSLRLYCVRYGSVAVILGGGGKKDNLLGTAWQDDPILKIQAEKMIEISNDIYERLREREIWWANDGKDLEGDLVFN